MRFAYELRNVLGAVYGAGNVLFTRDGNKLISPVGNRVTVYDLVSHETVTLPLETRKNVSLLALSPDNKLLLCIDEEGRAVLANFHRRVPLCHFNFKKPVLACCFSPDGKFIAVSHGKQVQVWHAPSARKSLMPFVLMRTYTGHNAQVTSITWSPDSQFFAAGSADLMVRVYSLHPRTDYLPFTLSGHRDALVLCAFAASGKEIVSLGRDGSLSVWQWESVAAEDLDAYLAKKRSSRTFMEHKRAKPQARAASSSGSDAEDSDSEDRSDEASNDGESDDADGTAVVTAVEAAHLANVPKEPLAPVYGQWKLLRKLFLSERSSRKVVCAHFHERTNLLLVGFSNGTFVMYEMPDGSEVHSLSISDQPHRHVRHQCVVRLAGVRLQSAGSAACVGVEVGDVYVFCRLARGTLTSAAVARLADLLKQQGHFFDMNTLAFSPDGRLLATGGDDGKVKLWNVKSGHCFVTFSEHSAPVTAVTFVPNGTAVLSSSLDGTVRAYDTIRYRNFRTMTSPEPTQFLSVACDSTGELVVASGQDPFNVYVWALQTAQLLDVLAGHEGPVSDVAVSPTDGMLATASWDRSVRLWDVTGGRGCIETLRCSSDVLTVRFRPDGKQVACSCLDGTILLFEVETGSLRGTIEGRRDVWGGRLASDRREAKNSMSNKHFSTICYSADGNHMLAAGRSKYICIYDLERQALLKRFQVSRNLSLDGMLDMLNSKNMGPNGPLDLGAVESDSDMERTIAERNSLPGTKKGDLVSRRVRRAIRVSSVRFDPTNRLFAASTTEGLLLFGTNDTSFFDPFELDTSITTGSVLQTLRDEQYAAALMMSLRLRVRDVIDCVLENTPGMEVGVVVHELAAKYLFDLLGFLVERITASPRVEFFLRWLSSLLLLRGRFLQENSLQFAGRLRAAQRALGHLHEDLRTLANGDIATLDYVLRTAALEAKPAATQPVSLAVALAATNATAATAVASSAAAADGANSGIAASVRAAETDASDSDSEPVPRADKKSNSSKVKASKKHSHSASGDADAAASAKRTPKGSRASGSTPSKPSKRVHAA